MKNSKSMIILLVALAALTLVVVVGLFFFYPKEQPKAVTTAPSAGASAANPTAPLPNEFDPVEWTRNPQTTSIQPTAAGQTGTDQGFTVTLPPETKVPTTQSLPVAPASVSLETRPKLPRPNLRRFNRRPWLPPPWQPRQKRPLL